MDAKEMAMAADNWWLGVIEGILLILFGLAALFWPGMTLMTLVYLFSAYVLVWAIMSIIGSLLGMRSNDTWWLTLIFGVFGLGVGVYLIRHPAVTFGTLVLLMGFVFIVRGIVDIASGFLGNQTGGSRVLNFIVGALGLLAGIVVLKQPVASGVAFVWIIGLYALVVGPMLLALAIQLHNDTKRLRA